MRHIYSDVRVVFLDHALGEPTVPASPGRGDPASRYVRVPPVPVRPARTRPDNTRLACVGVFSPAGHQRHDDNLSGKSYT